ncbi:helix-turn-helix domain-containing protein [Ferrimonas balearica]|uniref:helix-turn-helix domain-containing protein n=1 Tax=Ferrimonas balearica TaxID=44012 RepID=UPI001C992D44|nr:helix-turn-helix domain-containing protein [Ferrimonas balearica]MBY5920058.1 helix-turn-helix domain-containing protein [Ferrimonas balearica]MBY5997257.1 helix-turn-helix domain-containing protein [Ferrimonas balearica]
MKNDAKQIIQVIKDHFGYDNRQLAELTGLTPDAIRKLIRGDRLASGPTLAILHAIYINRHRAVAANINLLRRLNKGEVSLEEADQQVVL